MGSDLSRQKNKEGLELLNKNKYSDALVCFDKAIESNKNNANAYLNKGKCLDYLKDYKGAIKCYEEAIKLKKNIAYLNKADNLRILQDYNNSLKCYAEFLSNPENYLLASSAFHGMGCVYLDLKDFSKAKGCFENALEKDPFNKHTEYLLNQCTNFNTNTNTNIDPQNIQMDNTKKLPQLKRINLNEFSYSLDNQGNNIRLGGGLGGEVFKGTFRRTEVAIKKISVLSYNKKKIYNEITIMEKIDHPNLISLMGWAEDDHNIYILSKYVEAGNLMYFLHDYRNSNLSLSLKLSYIKQIALGLNYLHLSTPPIFHRDLKCLNILINNKSAEVYITDFGLAKEITQSYLHKVNPKEGTILWMAPELLDNIETLYDPSADIYSFAIVIWEILTQQIPYYYGTQVTNEFELREKILQGERPDIHDEKLQNVPNELIALMTSCWDAEKSRRPLSFDVICAILEKINVD